jgi:hypothetical protein
MGREPDCFSPERDGQDRVKGKGGLADGVACLGHGWYGLGQHAHRLRTYRANTGFGIDIDPDYDSTLLMRWEALAGETARLTE